MSRIITRFAKRDWERRGADWEEKNASYTRTLFKRSDISLPLIYFYGFSTHDVSRYLHIHTAHATLMLSMIIIIIIMGLCKRNHHLEKENKFEYRFRRAAATDVKPAADRFKVYLLSIYRYILYPLPYNIIYMLLQYAFCCCSGCAFIQVDT